MLEFIYMGDTFRTRDAVAGNDDFIMKMPERPRPASASRPARTSRSAGCPRTAARSTRRDDPPRRTARTNWENHDEDHHFLGSAALALRPWPRPSLAQDAATELPACDDCSDSMVIMSWGGAYQTSQLKAYVEPYVGADRHHRHLGRVLERGHRQAARRAGGRQHALRPRGRRGPRLASAPATRAWRSRSTSTRCWRPAPTAPPPSDDFGDSLINDCFVPQIVFSTTFGYRTDVAEWNGAIPDDICDVFDIETFPGMRALETAPKKNLEWALLCDGVAKEDLYDVLATEDGGVEQALAKLDTIKDSVIWWSAGAETPQLLADKEVVMGSTYNGRLFSVIDEQNQPVAMLWDCQIFDFDGWIVPAGLARGPHEPRDALPALRDRHPAPRRPGQVHRLRPGPRLVAAAGRHRTPTSASRWRRTCRPTRTTRRTSWSTTSSGGRTTRTRSRPQFQNWLAQ